MNKELVMRWIASRDDSSSLELERETNKVYIDGPTPKQVKQAEAWWDAKVVIAWLQDEHQGPENFRKIAYVRKHGPTLKQVQIAKNWKDFRDNFRLD